jgi:hypothetical protein
VGSRLHFYRISRRAVGALAAVGCVASGGAFALAARAAGGPTLSTARDCYIVGRGVALTGSGFAPGRTYVVTVDGVYLGKRTTDAQGNFTIPVYPGGLPAGVVQQVDQIEVSDGSSSASTKITVTRAPGGRILVSTANRKLIRGRFQVWGFSRDGVPRAIFVHYISPSGHRVKTISIGTTRGQCGYLKTPSRLVFPLAVPSGTWTLQIDTRQKYARRPGGPMTRISVHVKG